MLRLYSIATLLILSMACNISDPVQTTDPDTGVDTDAGGEEDDVFDVIDDDLNACGGETELFFGGVPSEPGESCGDCSDGTLLCDGHDRLRCAGATALNECGGCGLLPGSEDDACGPCGSGVYVCGTDGELFCESALEENACGGCQQLDNEPGHVCEVSDGTGLWGCEGPNSTRCVLPGENACGGEGVLDDAPGTACGTCGQGVVACDGPEETVCLDEDRGENACGGCEILAANPGANCGRCNGQWTCDGTSEVVCNEPTRNACGGCQDFGGNRPGDACGSNSIYVCHEDELQCLQGASNACGGTTTLSAQPGDSCGQCGDGYSLCASPEQTVCIGARLENACGGCSSLVALPQTPCPGGGLWQCDGEDGLSCPIDVADPASSTITGQTGALADGEVKAGVTIALLTENQDPLVGVVPKFAATGAGNGYRPCGPTNQDGVARCAMTSTEAGEKTLSITHPVAVDGDMIEFRNELWTTSGTVRAVVEDGDRVYVAGSFQYVGPPTGAFVSVDEQSAEQTTSWPAISSQVRAAVADGNGGWFVAGTFTTVAGFERQRLVHIRPDGTINPDWNPGASGTITSLAIYGNNLYVGGVFTTIGGQARTNLAALDTSDGTVNSWSPNPNTSVETLLVNGSTLFVGGRFSTFDGADRTNLAAVNLTNHSVLNFNANVVGIGVYSLAADEGRLYVGGRFSTVGGTSRANLAAVFLSSGNLVTTWSADVNEFGTVMALETGSDGIYVGGLFTSIRGVSRSRLAKLNKSNGAVISDWDPSPNTSVRALARRNNRLYVGGDFRTIDGEDQDYIAALSTSDGTLEDWNPVVAASVYSITASGNEVIFGGIFTSTGGARRANIAAFNRIDGALLDWEANVSGSINAMVMADDRLYVGGYFWQVDGETRRTLAALNAGDGSLVANWDPAPNDTSWWGYGPAVESLVIDGDTLYVGGMYNEIAGVDRLGVAALNVSTGTATSWAPNIPSPFDPYSDEIEVFDIAVGDDQVFVGGWFYQFGGESRQNLVAIDKSSGQIVDDFEPNPSSSVNALLLYEDTLYVGGNFTSIGGESRNRIAALSVADGAPTNWDPNASSGVRTMVRVDDTLYVGGWFAAMGDEDRDRLAAISLADDAAILDWNPGADNAVLMLQDTGPLLYVGGSFNTIRDMRYRPRFTMIPTAQ